MGLQTLSTGQRPHLLAWSFLNSAEDIAQVFPRLYPPVSSLASAFSMSTGPPMPMSRLRALIMALPSNRTNDQEQPVFPPETCLPRQGQEVELSCTASLFLAFLAGNET